MTDIYQFDDYRQFLRAVIQENRETWGFQSRLAEAAGCQRSYLSQVLAERASLTPDHAAAISEYLNLSEDRAAFLFDLVNLDRAATPKLRSWLKKRIETRRRQSENLAHRYHQPPTVTSSGQALYYSAWVWQAVHILVGIPGFQSSIAIAEKLGLPEEYISSVLGTLAELDLVKQTSHRVWQVAQGKIHLSKDSPLVSTSHQNWRQQAVLDSQMRRNDSLHYTSVQSHSITDYKKIKQMLLEAIDKSRDVIADSPSQEMTCLTLDFFVVGSPANFQQLSRDFGKPREESVTVL